MNISQQIVELLGQPHCWHEVYTEECRHMVTNERVVLKGVTCIKCGKVEHNPNYEDDAGAVALLRVMKGRLDGERFIFDCLRGVKTFDEGTMTYEFHIPVRYLTTPGLLAKVVLEWLKGREK